jgi:hypothetical protein
VSTDLRDLVCAVMDCIQLAQRGPHGGILFIFVFHSTKLSVAQVM